MSWRRSLPVRVALATTGLLSLLLLTLTVSAFFLTASILRQGVDLALMTVVPPQSRDLATLLARAGEFERLDPGARLVQVITPEGAVESGAGVLPVDPRALAAVRERGIGFSSAVPEDGGFITRSGPGWWQALSPAWGEIRVLYVPTGPPWAPRVLQLGMPIGMVGTSCLGFSGA